MDRAEDLDSGLATARPFDERGDEEGEEAGRLGEGDVTHGFDEAALYWHTVVLFGMQTRDYGARMQTMTRESWTDERLDDLSGRVSDGFRQVDERFRQVDDRFERVEGEIKDLRGEMTDRFDRVDSRFDQVNARIDGMQQTMLQGVIGLCSVFAAGFGVLGALIVTQL